MGTLITGLILFLGIHLLRETGMRESMVRELGTGPYRLIFSVVAVTGLVLVFWGRTLIPFIQVYTPLYQFRYLGNILMLPAVILVVAGSLPQSWIRRSVVHPMLTGIILWGGAHLWTNGDLASLLLFGAFTLWALAKMTSLGFADRKTAKRPWFFWDLAALVVGCLLYFFLVTYHGDLFGVGVVVCLTMAC
ncbi:MAG: NnrU family protein [Pseudohongiellaceae bacterium]